MGNEFHIRRETFSTQQRRGLFNYNDVNCARPVANYGRAPVCVYSESGLRKDRFEGPVFPCAIIGSSTRELVNWETFGDSVEMNLRPNRCLAVQIPNGVKRNATNSSSTATRGKSNVGTHCNIVSISQKYRPRGFQRETFRSTRVQADGGKGESRRSPCDYRWHW